MTGSFEVFFGVPHSAAYSATKNFVLAFGEALWGEQEAEETKVDVLVLAPSTTDTAIIRAHNMRETPVIMQPSEVAEYGLEQSLAREETKMTEARHALPSDYAERYGPWAVIAGGSEGIGESFARQLAATGISLVLLARREEPLRSLARSIERESSVEVRTLSVDLTAHDLVARVRETTDGLDVGLLIYNAGATIGYNRFPDWSTDELDFMIRMNCNAPVHLAHHFSRGMCKRGRGGLMFLSAIAGICGSAWMTIYPATKAFDQMLGEGLWHDLKPHGVDAMSLLVGATRTPSHEKVDFAKLGGDLPDGGAMSCDDVAYEGLSHLGQGPLWIPGKHNRALLPPGYLESRAQRVEWMSSATAAINGLPHEPAIG